MLVVKIGSDKLHCQTLGIKCECHMSSDALCYSRSGTLKTLTVQWPYEPSIVQNLQPFTGIGDASKWVKNSRVGRKTPNKQKQISWVGGRCGVPNSRETGGDHVIWIAKRSTTSVNDVTSPRADVLVTRGRRGTLKAWLWMCRLSGNCDISIKVKNV